MMTIISSTQPAPPRRPDLGRRGTVRPGFLAKFLELSLKLLPRRGRVRMMGVVMRGMTPRQSSPTTSHS